MTALMLLMRVRVWCVPMRSKDMREYTKLRP